MVGEPPLLRRLRRALGQAAESNWEIYCRSSRIYRIRFSGGELNFRKKAARCFNSKSSSFFIATKHEQANRSNKSDCKRAAHRPANNSSSAETGAANVDFRSAANNAEHCANIGNSLFLRSANAERRALFAPRAPRRTLLAARRETGDAAGGETQNRAVRFDLRRVRKFCRKMKQNQNCKIFCKFETFL